MGSIGISTVLVYKRFWTELVDRRPNSKWISPMPDKLANNSIDKCKIGRERERELKKRTSGSLLLFEMHRQGLSIVDRRRSDSNNTG